MPLSPDSIYNDYSVSSTFFSSSDQVNSVGCVVKQSFLISASRDKEMAQASLKLRFTKPGPLKIKRGFEASLFP
jgi:uncharacterized protein YaiE (UPF0345 family)